MKYFLLNLMVFVTSVINWSKPQQAALVFTGNLSLPVRLDNAGLEALQERAQGLADQINAIVNLAETENRDLTEDELLQVENLGTDFDQLELQIKAKQRALNVSAGRQSTPTANAKNSSQAAPNAAAKKPGAVYVENNAAKKPWENFGEFALAVQNASRPGAGGDIDIRLQAPGVFGQEAVGADGGFAVPDEFINSIMKKVMAEDSLMSRCDQLTTSRNSVVIPQDNVAPWDESQGIQAFWTGEAEQYQQSKLKLGTKQESLHKLTVLAPVTEELLEDAPLIESYLMQKVPEKMDFKISRAILAGDGVGKPKGIWESGSNVVVAKESGQAADTLNFENITKMWSRLYSGCMANAVWIANQDCLPQMQAISHPNGQQAAYMPPGGISAAPYGTLMGRPVIFHEAAETIGDEGDLTLVDLRKYLILRKQAGIQAASSIHLYFDYDVTAFKFGFRMSGSSWWKDAIEPRSGSGNTLGCSVTLAERS